MKLAKCLSITAIIVLAIFLPFQAQAITPVSFPFFHVTDPSTGMPEVGGLVWSYQAGTSTQSYTYSDPGFAHANSFPIVLDSDGNCIIYINQPTKLVIEGPPPSGYTHGSVLFTIDNLEAAPYNQYVTVGPGPGGGVPTPGSNQLNLYCSGTTLYMVNSTGAVTSPVTSNAIQQQIYVAAAGGGTGDAITATFTPALTSFVDKTTVWVWAPAANTTTTPTFSPNGLTAKTIVKGSNLALVAGDIAGANAAILLEYNAVLGKWVLLNPAYPFPFPLLPPAIPAPPIQPIQIGVTNISAAATTTIGLGTYAFTISASNVSVGAVYSNNSQNFTVIASIYGGTTLTAVGSGAPLSTGTLTLVFGTGPATIAFSSESLVAGTRFRLLLNLTQNTSTGYAYLQCNGDTGSNYSNAFLLNGGAGASSGVDYLYLNSPSYVAYVGGYDRQDVLIEPAIGSTNTALISGEGFYQYASTTMYSFLPVGIYAGSAPLSSITIGTSAGTLSGKATLYVVP